MDKIEAYIGYDKDALVPVLSSDTLFYHYEKHHKGYEKNLLSFIKDTKYESMDLKEIIVKSRGNDDKIFNNAGQLFNHNFYWNCLKVSDGKRPTGKLKSLIDAQFPSFENFLDEYIAYANTMFGSGWSWVLSNDDELSFLNTSNAGTPIGSYHKPICVIDLWEHAYYIDYRNDRATYISKIVKECINWDFCESQI
jgi:Fe-Mn family superoxide dismutase